MTSPPDLSFAVSYDRRRSSWVLHASTADGYCDVVKDVLLTQSAVAKMAAATWCAPLSVAVAKANTQAQRYAADRKRELEAQIARAQEELAALTEPDPDQ